jgi:hypothetical protein
MKWPAEARADRWATAPRIKIADTGLEVGSATALSLDLYLETGRSDVAPLEVNPVLQYPPSWWNQLPPVRLEYADGRSVGSRLLKFPVRVPLSLAPDTRLAHLLLVVIGAGSGYEGEVYLDNISLVAQTNGDAAKAPAAADDPGRFAGLPWDFEDGSRQGWTVAAVSGASRRAFPPRGWISRATSTADFPWSCTCRKGRPPSEPSRFSRSSSLRSTATGSS